MAGRFDIAAAAETFVRRHEKTRKQRRDLHDKACRDFARIVDMAIRDFNDRNGNIIRFILAVPDI